MMRLPNDDGGEMKCEGKMEMNRLNVSCKVQRSFSPASLFESSHALRRRTLEEKEYERKTRISLC